DSNIKKFELRGTKGSSVMGIWVTDDVGFAEMFGEHVIETKIYVKNPYFITQDKWDDIRSDHATDASYFKKWRDNLIEKGHDALYVKERIQKFAGHDVRDPNIVCVFDPTTIIKESVSSVYM